MNVPHLIDVREDYEFDEISIPGSLNLPLSAFQNHIETIKNLQGEKIIYCRSGMRSSNALTMLRQHGVTDAQNGGGISDVQNWLSAQK